MTQDWRAFGRYEILLLLDGTFETTSDVIVHAKGETARQSAIAACGPRLKVDVNCFALRSDDGVMLVDAGTGPSWGPSLGQARGALQAAGISPEAVNRVLLTHIHGDHALGLFDDAQAYFPMADIIVPDADLAFFTDEEMRAKTPETRRVPFDVAKNLLAVYQDRVRPIPPGPVLPEIEAVALPGHTPGHSGYLIGAGPDRLLLWGDTLHLGDVQPADPDIGLAFDIDPAQAVLTRRAALEQAAPGGWTVAGGHIRGFNRVRTDGDGFRIAAA